MFEPIFWRDEHLEAMFRKVRVGVVCSGHVDILWQ
jgi:hypothetical protein